MSDREISVLRVTGWFLALSLAVLSGRTFASFERLPAGVFLPRPGVLGEAVPASTSRRIVYAEYSPGLFGLPELAGAHLAYQDPFPFGTLGFGTTLLGSSLYREISAGLSYSTTLGGIATVGLGARWLGLGIKGYGSDWTIGLDAGCIISFTEELALSLLAKNLNRPTVGVSRDPLPQSITMSVMMRPASSLYLFATLEKESDFASECAFGAEFSPVGAVAIGVAMTVTTGEFRASISLAAGACTASYTVAVDPILGPTHRASIAVDFGGS